MFATDMASGTDHEEIIMGDNRNRDANI
jgi:hypothetical protein